MMWLTGRCVSEKWLLGGRTDGCAAQGGKMWRGEWVKINSGTKRVTDMKKTDCSSAMGVR